MPINFNSEAYCRKVYLDYHCYGNTLNTSPQDMGKITQKWADRIPSWQESVSNDQVEYEFDDSEYEMYIDEGYRAAQDTTGYDGGKGGMIANGCVDGALSVAGTVGTLAGGKIFKKWTAKLATQEVLERGLTEVVENGTVELTKGEIRQIAKNGAKAGAEKFVGKGTEASVQKVAEAGAEEIGKEVGDKVTEQVGEKAGEKAGEKVGEEVGKQVGDKVTTETTSQATKDAGKTVGCIIGCIMGAATATKYLIQKPNKEQKEACDALQTEMTGAQAVLCGSQNEMAVMSNEIITLSDEANTRNEEANETIEEKKTEYDMYMQTYSALKAKIDAGEALTDSEKELYKEVVTYLTETGIVIEETAEQTTDEVADLYDEINSYQEGYDNVAETMGQVEGLTNYAEGFDKATKTMCYVEAGVQGLNVISSTKAAYEAFALGSSGSWAFGATAWAYAFAAMGAYGAVTSGIGAGQQIKWAGEVGTEIELREGTQMINTDTMAVYTEEVDAYAGWQEGVEDLTIAIPEDIEAPDDIDTSLLEEPTGADAVPEALKPKKDDDKT